ncbi:MAG: dimethylargininase [Acidimicrobiales bacterium]
MCAPTYFSVDYEINPWMDAGRPVRRRRAVRQWEGLVSAVVDLGHEVELVAPAPGLPDMVFAANAGLAVGSKVLVSRFRHPERAEEASRYAAWFSEAGFEVERSRSVNEGEGDLLVAGGVVLGGYGLRTERAAHAEVEDCFGMPVVSLRLIDPRYYHLDTALAVLSDSRIAWYPQAFDAPSQARLRELFPEAVVASDADAEAFGLNAISDGRNVLLPREAEGLAAALCSAGFNVVGIEVSELRRAGGGPKCCALERYCAGELSR